MLLNLLQYTDITLKRPRYHSNTQLQMNVRWKKESRKQGAKAIRTWYSRMMASYAAMLMLIHSAAGKHITEVWR